MTKLIPLRYNNEKLEFCSVETSDGKEIRLYYNCNTGEISLLADKELVRSEFVAIEPFLSGD